MILQSQKLKFEAYGKSDVGRMRANNEDNFLVDEKIGLFMIADGMGGHSSGEVASKMAIDVIHDSMNRFVTNSQQTILGKINPKFGERANQLASSIRLSNQCIFESAKNDPAHQGMGTTIDCIFYEKDKVSIGHIGDSRVYLIRSGKIHQLTEDHSVVAEQVRQGILKPEEAELSPLKHILTRALGVDETVEVDLNEIDCYDEDILISCTDGLNKTVSDPAILKTVQEMKTPKMIVEHLIDLANVGGGVDNTTVVAVRFKK
jgi:PPM family protein phosphatase